MKRSLLFCFLIVFAATRGYATIDTSNTDNKTAPIAISSAWDITDSLYYIPAYDEYCGFDQNSIWGARKDILKSQDTSHFQLYHDSCDFVSPWEGRVTSPFGWRNHKPHYGVDIKLNTGDSVRNAFGGMVRISKYSSSYGNVVVVRHQNGLETLYAHLSRRLVMEGDIIESGEVLGLGGNTGRSFGSHLHFETRYLGQPIDPTEIFEINDSTFNVKSKEFELTAANFKLVREASAIKYHRIRSGDSLWRISKKYGVSVSTLCRLNSISRKKTLRIGQRIRYN